MGECQKSWDWKPDGCQEFKPRKYDREKCDVCNCHLNFHRKVTPPVKYQTEVVYTKCHKIHEFKFPNSVDGCQEFIPGAGAASLNCAVCGCHKGFHRNEITKQVY